MRFCAIVILLLPILCAEGQDCVVSPANSYVAAEDTMFAPIRIVAPVDVSGSKGAVPRPEFQVPLGTEAIVFEHAFCTASDSTFVTSGDEVRFGTYDPIYIVEKGRSLTGNIFGPGLQPGDLSNSDASITRITGESFSVTDRVTFDIVDLSPGEYVVQVLQGLPFVYADNPTRIHPDGDVVTHWPTSIVMTIQVPEPSGHTVLSILFLIGIRCRFSRRRT